MNTNKYNLKQFIHNNKLLTCSLTILATYLTVAVSANFLTPYSFNSYKSHGKSFLRDSPPSLKHPFGTNAQNFDIYTRVIFGARTALLTISVSILLSLVVGIALALVGGYIGGVLDQAINIFISVIFAIPSLVVAIIFSVLLSGLKIGGIFSVAIAIALSYVPQYYRAINTLVLQIKNEPYIISGKIFGAGIFYTMRRHILPNILSPIPSIATMNAAEGVSTLAGLGFLGLGIQPDQGAEWGYDIQRSMDGLNSGIWWPALFPILALTLLTTSLSLTAIVFRKWDR